MRSGRRLLSWGRLQSRRMRMAAGAVAIVSSFAVVLAAQRGAEPQTQQPTFRARADLIQVDTVVVDKEGRPVRGLTKADFQLLDNGKPQEIVALTEYQHERVVLGTDVEPPQVDVATNSGPTAQRLVLIMLDDLGIQSGLGESEGGDSVIRSWRPATDRPGRTSGRAVLSSRTTRRSCLTLSVQVAAADTGAYRQEQPLAVRKCMQFLTPNDGRRKVMLLVSHSGIR